MRIFDREAKMFKTFIVVFYVVFAQGVYSKDISKKVANGKLREKLTKLLPELCSSGGHFDKYIASAANLKEVRKKVDSSLTKKNLTEKCKKGGSVYKYVMDQATSDTPDIVPGEVWNMLNACLKCVTVYEIIEVKDPTCKSKVEMTEEDDDGKETKTVKSCAEWMEY
jgi:hypothetical protein